MPLNPPFDLSNVIWFFHPQVDQVQTCITSDHVEVSTEAEMRNMHGVTGFDDVNNLLGIAINQKLLRPESRKVVEKILAML